MPFPPNPKSDRNLRTAEPAASDLYKALDRLVQGGVMPLDPLRVGGIEVLQEAPAVRFASWRDDESPEAKAKHISHVLSSIIAYAFDEDEGRLAEAMFALHHRYADVKIGRRIEILATHHGLGRHFYEEHRRAVLERIVFRLRDVEGARPLTALRGGPVIRYLAQILLGEVTTTPEEFMFAAANAEHQLHVADVLVRMTDDIPRGIACMSIKTRVGRALTFLARSHARVICSAGGLLTQPSVLALTAERQAHLSDLFQVLLGSGPFIALGDVSFLQAWEAEDRNTDDLAKRDDSWLEGSVRGLWKVWLDGIDTMRHDPPPSLLSAMTVRALQDALVSYEVVAPQVRGVAARAGRRLPVEVSEALPELEVDADKLLDRVAQIRASYAYQPTLNAYLNGISNPYRSWPGGHPPWLLRAQNPQTF